MKRLREIIEEMGFKKTLGEYSATFEDDATGSIMEVIIKEGADENGVRILEFHFFDEQGNFLEKYYLDQMIVACVRNLTLVPKKSNKKYQSNYYVEIGVPVDMSCIQQETFNHWYSEGVEKEVDIANRIAYTDLKEWLDKCPFNVMGTDHNHTEEI